MPDPDGKGHARPLSRPVRPGPACFFIHPFEKFLARFLRQVSGRRGASSCPFGWPANPPARGPRTYLPVRRKKSVAGKATLRRKQTVRNTGPASDGHGPLPVREPPGTQPPQWIVCVCTATPSMRTITSGKPSKRGFRRPAPRVPAGRR